VARREAPAALPKERTPQVCAFRRAIPHSDEARGAAAKNEGKENEKARMCKNITGETAHDRLMVRRNDKSFSAGTSVFLP
jgi:hypothetical protein